MGLSEPQAPADLASLQQAFSAAMRTPLIIAKEGFAWQSEDWDPDLVQDMADGPLLEGEDRLAIYNQQYWFRLLTTMQNEFPLVRRRMGTIPFNQAVTRYLDRYPSENANLNHLGDRFIGWLIESGQSAALVEAATLDDHHRRVFLAAEETVLDGRSLSPEELAALSEKPLPFSPAWRLFKEEHSQVEDRIRAVRESDDDRVIVPRAGEGWWVIYRPAGSGVQCEDLGPAQYRLLELLAHEQRPLGPACEILAAELSPEALQRLGPALSGWFKHWTELGWFVRPEASGLIHLFSRIETARVELLQAFGPFTIGVVLRWLGKEARIAVFIDAQGRQAIGLEAFHPQEDITTAMIPAELGPPGKPPRVVGSFAQGFPM
jgi:hypothetical protein